MNNINSQYITNNKEKLQIKNFMNMDREKQLKQACEDFEALFYDMVMKTARKTVSNDGIIKRSFGEEVFTEMLDSKFSEEIAKSTKGGLKDILFNQLKATINQSYNQDLKNKAGKNYPGIMA
ncbi:rod-binding protein [Calditerrivibrio nitroreducens]|uniref:Flagellar protein FlgJ n=1 Tax=Calditerrivibrio nitroreducens (strain DSM 19672 / NBRC 101217 / Yu37-1) TaxID=768670 RepID=E4TJH2_CALNY|nr:rod-binding protein [Calditerrivibrio nitroreducens]ADR18134.1 Flagellar protein FlgJ [Calditerrivibrio nitroreducens DSM 19672]